ncbi:unnamed protein product [Rotaria socialis]|uniref:Uncharacterized protein n=2 Tax=Rotaria socialis TaxID=392032 RepID=A0A821MQE7_9BILA|nr:unnamed protein product [Rotaria socialis]CAF4773745.1 unnamed protein product [Rotaria socialis]
MGHTHASGFEQGHKQSNNQNNGEVSAFYWACRNGDIELAKAMAPDIPYDQLNRLEPNGSTPLHAASFFSHADVVELLLHEYGVPRNYVNQYGLTAYEEAQTERVKRLFWRVSNRFCDPQENVTDTFDILAVKADEIENNRSIFNTEDEHEEDTKEAPEQSIWLQSYQAKDIKEEIYYYRKGKALIQSSIARFIMRQGPKFCPHCKQNKEVMNEFISYFDDATFRVNKLKAIVYECVPPTDKYYNRCHQLLTEYSEKGNVEALLTLYTLETEFYKKIANACQAISWSIYITLPSLEQRFFKGTSYRGLKMSKEEINQYRWALKNSESLIKTKTFSSTSIKRDTAEGFAVGSDSDRFSVLIILEFPEVSDMAINLGKIEKQKLQCIAEFEEEQEVLILPQTFFRVKNIEFNTEKDQHEIHLQNILVKKSSLLSALKFMIVRDEEPKLIDYYVSHKF